MANGVGIFYHGVFPPITPPVVPTPHADPDAHPDAHPDADADAHPDGPAGALTRGSGQGFSTRNSATEVTATRHWTPDFGTMPVTS